MSVHGICFDNGQSGRCDYQCEQFRGGDCEEPDSAIKSLFNFYMEDSRKRENLESDLRYKFGDVKLWVLRHGENLNDLELLTKALGY